MLSPGTPSVQRYTVRGLAFLPVKLSVHVGNVRLNHFVFQSSAIVTKAFWLYFNIILVAFPINLLGSLLINWAPYCLTGPLLFDWTPLLIDWASYCLTGLPY